MPRYIAIPRNLTSTAAPFETSGGYTPQARFDRIESVRKSKRKNKRMFLPGALLQDLRKARNKGVVTPEREMPLTGVTIIDGDPEDAERLQNELPDHEVIQDFELELVAPTIVEAPTTNQESLDLWHLDAIAFDKARSAGFNGTGAGVGVAVLDTGVANVEEVSGRIKGSWELDELEIVATDTKDTDGHGTGVASLIAGKNVGIATGTDIYNVITIPHRSGCYSNFVIATEFVAGQPGISIVNISAGIVGWEPRIKAGVQALLDTYILPIVAVGNEGADTSRSPGNYSEVLSVGAANKRGRVWSGSGSGTIVHDSMSYTVPDVVAPGERVTTCNGAGEFRVFNGSSMAAPIVSGIAALIIEKYPNISDHELRDEIFEACLRLENAPPLRQGTGMVQMPTTLLFTGV